MQQQVAAGVLWSHLLGEKAKKHKYPVKSKGVFSLHQWKTNLKKEDAHKRVMQIAW